MHSTLVIFKVDHIFRLLSKQVASEQEMNNFEQETEKLGELIPKYFPTSPITPKLDILGMSIWKIIMI